MFSAKECLYNLATYKIKGPLAAFLRGFLFLLSLAYGLAVVILAFIYRISPLRLNAKVISVGNITLGGTGKTSFVEYLAGFLTREGKKTAILSRGYKRKVDKTGSQGLGDEPAMLQNKFPQVPVIVDKDRVKAASRAIKDYAADTLILDDGLQQWRIRKDLEIVAFDAGNPFGNYRLLPAGFLREPLSALKRADIFVLTQVNFGRDTGALADKLKRINPRALIVESVHQPQGFSSAHNPDELLGLEALKGKRVAVFSGIGNPQGFENCIHSLGINLGRSFRFTDHHDYTQADLLRIIKGAQDNNLDAIITTQKDAVKIRQLEIGDSRILVLDIKLSITKNEAELNRRLLKLYSF